MRKQKAIAIFGGRHETATAIGISSQAVSDWPDILPPRIEDRIIAAAFRLGKPMDEFRPKPARRGSGSMKLT